MDGDTSKNWDVLIKNGRVFDGTGAAGVVRDIAIKNGRVAAIGSNLGGHAAQTVDASSRWVMPGLLDVHTHLDLEVELAPELPEVVRHGTTTVVMSNCSLGVAFGNQRRNGDDPIVDCFARVENVPKHVLRKVADAVTWNDSAGYIQHFEKLALGPNVVPMIPHSMLRVEVMGLQASVSREPSDDELKRMGALVEKGMREGYVGFSTDGLPFHFLANKPNTHKQIPTQFAPYKELKFLTGIVRNWGRVWQATPPKDDKVATLRNFMLTSGRLHGRPLKVTAVAALDVHSDRRIIGMGRTLSKILNSWMLKGFFRFQALAAPFKVWSDGLLTPLAEEVPEMRRLNECDLEDRAGRLTIMNDPAYIAAFKKMWFRGKHGFTVARLLRWLRLDQNVLSRDLRDMTVESCPVPDWSGETLHAVYERLLGWQQNGQGARSEKERECFASFAKPVADDADFFLHLLRRYDTDLRWWTVTANRDARVYEDLLFHPQLLPGFNDSGAHLTNMAFYDGNLRALQIAQKRGETAVAQMVHRLTLEPAEFFGLNTGVLKVGAQADVILVDPRALATYQSEKHTAYLWRETFGHHQMANRSDGVVTDVFIAGKSAWRDSAYTPAFGKEKFGRVLLDSQHEQGLALPLAA